MQIPIGFAEIYNLFALKIVTHNFLAIGRKLPTWQNVMRMFARKSIGYF